MVDPWTTAQRVLGRWEGPATGRPGVGRQVREYRLILRGRFILGTDETRWVPTPEEPEGLFHEDLSVLGLDRAAGQLVMRSFHGEGFVHDARRAFDPILFTVSDGSAALGSATTSATRDRPDQSLPVTGPSGATPSDRAPRRHGQ